MEKTSFKNRADKQIKKQGSTCVNRKVVDKMNITAKKTEYAQGRSTDRRRNEEKTNRLTTRT